MRRFYYQFGFTTPGSDAEEIESIWIRADSQEQALEWGDEIALRFVQKLFDDPEKSWMAGGFPKWIEDASESKESDPDQKAVQTVRIGGYPDFARMVQRWRGKGGIL